MSFNNIIGNNNIKNILSKSLNSNKILHSYMFIGRQGIGKNLLAKQFAKMIMCQEYDNGECGNCKSCIEFDGGNNPDFLQINPDGKVIKIEQKKICEILEFKNILYKIDNEIIFNL